MQQIHEQGLLHCDLKPDNILLKSCQLEHCRELVLIDFGLSMSYLEEESPDRLKHIDLTKCDYFNGNSCYASRRAMDGYSKSQLIVNAIGLSRSDDMESLLYILLSLKDCGDLLWVNRDTYKRSGRYLSFEEIKEVKMKMKP